MKQPESIDLREASQPTHDHLVDTELMQHLNNNRFLSQELVKGQIAEACFGMFQAYEPSAPTRNELLFSEAARDLRVNSWSHVIDEAKGMVVEFGRPKHPQTTETVRLVCIKQKLTDEQGELQGPPNIVGLWAYKGETLPLGLQTILGYDQEPMPTV